ncbi:uncharacterized protein LOC128225596 [Mya arenaria]|uniref:uncharacterized protein LOC128225596 n=1 Tax=Mya arenaria TaxID=6604 RepID=UPI0022E346E4|nr:uncharacterized protein LOC128225596 [Mya arenaria]
MSDADIRWQIPVACGAALSGIIVAIVCVACARNIKSQKGLHKSELGRQSALTSPTLKQIRTDDAIFSLDECHLKYGNNFRRPESIIPDYETGNLRVKTKTQTNQVAVGTHSTLNRRHSSLTLDYTIPTIPRPSIKRKPDPEKAMRWDVHEYTLNELKSARTKTNNVENMQLNRSKSVTVISNRETKQYFQEKKLRRSTSGAY